MARKGRQGEVKRQSKIEFRGYVNYPVDRETGEEFAAWYNHQENVFEAALELALKDQLKFSIGEDTYHEAYTASYMNQNRSDPACGCVLTAWSKDFYTAIGLLVYKHVVLAQRQWHYEASGRSTNLDFG